MYFSFLIVFDIVKIRRADGLIDLLHKVIRTLSSGDIFGELALLSDNPRSATITTGAEEGCAVLKLYKVRMLGVYRLSCWN